MVVEVVGATDSGPTSGQCGRISGAAAASASIEPGLPVMAMIGMPTRWKWSITGSSSAVSPLCEISSATSPLRGHAEVAVDRFGQVEEDRGRAGRGEGRGDLAPDMARLAQPADDQLAAAVEDQRDRALELCAQAVGQRIERARLVVQHLATEIQHVSTHRRVGHAPQAPASRAFASVRLAGRDDLRRDEVADRR